MDKDLVDQVVDVAQRVVASGAISANGHGNVSLRVPGAQEMYFTARPSLRNHAATAVVRVGLDGALWRETCRPSRALWSPCTQRCMTTTMMSAASCTRIRPMRPPTPLPIVGSGAGLKPWPCSVYRPGFPWLATGPRGSAQAVANIRAAITPGVPAVLLANHGVLVFHRTPELAVQVGGIIEEAAQAGINAAASADRSRSLRNSGPRRCSGARPAGGPRPGTG